MKWHIICLIVILGLYVNPIRAARPSATDCEPLTWSGPSTGAAYVITTLPSQPGVSYMLLWAYWQAVVWTYGARPGRVMLCRWRLTWRRVRSSGRKKRRTRPRRPGPSRSTSDAPRLESAAHEPAAQTATDAEEEGNTPLRLVVQPGVILSKRGLQLRPLIAQLGNDVAEYRALWDDKGRFKATIRPLLQRTCPLCDGQRGFRCIGSDRRSVIPPGRRIREWFRIQKIECRMCGADTRTLPTFCIPFKSHHAQTIQNALENCWRRNTSYRDTTAVLNQSLP